MNAELLASLPSPGILFASFLIIICGAFVQSALGMGLGMASAPFLALLDPTLVPGPPLILSVLTAGSEAFRQRAGVRYGEFGLATLGRALGAAVAAVVLVKIADRSKFSLLFGIATLVAVALSAVSPAIAFTRINLVAMSAVSGIMGTITSVGAPPLALLYRTRSAASARPTLNAFFATGAAISLAALAFAGWLGAREIIVSALLLPAVPIGIWIAHRFREYTDRPFRYLLWSLAGIAGLILVVRPLVE